MRNKRNIFYVVLLTLVFFSLPLCLKASVYISEIMYDLPGTDSGREWIEIYNDGSEAVDLTNWKLFENETNHTLKGNSFSLSSSGYAVIADDTTKFLADNPNFSGIIFDSTFSLVNTGEVLKILDKDGNISDSVLYDPNIGGAGDGNSLQKIDGVWKASSITPGSQNSFSPSETPNDNSTPPAEEDVIIQNNEKAKSESFRDNPSYPKDFSLKIEADQKSIPVGFPVSFKAVCDSCSVFRWNFGDGNTSEKKEDVHIFDRPGEYLVILRSPYLFNDLVARLKITVVIPDLIFSSVNFGKDGFVEITNESKYEVNLSSWVLTSNSTFFKIPYDTFILSKGKIMFYGKKMGMDISSDLKLLSPSGSVAKSYFSGQNSIQKDSLPSSNNSKDYSLSVENKTFSQENLVNTALALNSTDNREKTETKEIPKENSWNIGFVWYLSAFIVLAIVSSVGVFFVKKKFSEEIEIIE